MSFKIFTLQLTGKIKPVSAIESQRKALADDYEEFKKVENSNELKIFLELEKRVTSAEFKRKRREVEGMKFKGSEEYNLEREFKRLRNSNRIRKYFKAEGSSDLKRYKQEKDSQKITDYYLLQGYLKEGQFEKEKNEIKSQVFKGSKEEKLLTEFRRLNKSSAIRAFKELDGSLILKKHKALEETEKFKKFNHLKNINGKDKEKRKEFKVLKRDSELRAYFRFEKSKKLKLYHEIIGSYDLTRYNELKELVNSETFKKQEAFLKDKKKFDKSEAFKKRYEFKQLAVDSVVKFVLKYGKSDLYKNYLDVKDSFDFKRYFELEKMVGSEEFKTRKRWLEDKKRWKKTNEFKDEQQYFKEKKKPEFVKYFKYKGTTYFDFFKEWEVAFEDDFTGNEINIERWGTCSPIAQKLLGENYAMPGDLNFFTNGQNIKTGNKLAIQVKHEKINGKVWQMPAGFMPVDFEYTSGMVTSAGKFMLEDGILEAKIKFNPVKQVVSAFKLSGEESTPCINLFEMGFKNNVGISRLNGGGKIETSGLDISNLKKGDYIFSLEKQGASFSWKINDTEVCQQSCNELNTPLNINVSSLVTEKIQGSQLPVNFEINWVKYYRKR